MSQQQDDNSSNLLQQITPLRQPVSTCRHMSHMKHTGRNQSLIETCTCTRPPVLSVHEYMQNYKRTARIDAAESASVQCTIHSHRPLVYWTGTVVSGVTCTRYLHGAVRALLRPVEHGVLPPAGHPQSHHSVPDSLHGPLHLAVSDTRLAQEGRGVRSGRGKGGGRERRRGKQVYSR